MRVWGLITVSDRSVDSATVEQKRRLAPPEKDEIFVPVMTGQGTRRETGRPDRRRGSPRPGRGLLPGRAGRACPGPLANWPPRRCARRSPAAAAAPFTAWPGTAGPAAAGHLTPGGEREGRGQATRQARRDGLARARLDPIAHRRSSTGENQ